MTQIMTENDPIQSFTNRLSANMVGLSVPEYVHTCEDLILFLDKIKNRVEEATVDEMKSYKRALEIKSILSSLCCYCFNNNKDWETVNKIENIIGDKLIKFAKTYKKITPNQRKLGKYILWRYSFVHENQKKIARDLLNADMLRKDENGNYYVIGILLSVGDNTFGISKNGKEYRKFIPVCGFMAIGVSRFMTFDTWQETLKMKMYQC